MSRLMESRTRARPGGRSEQVRLRVANVCLDLLAAGDADFGPAEVARRSGVSRATVHRWWPTKADLVREALTLHTRSLAVPDTGSWSGDLQAFAAQLAEFFADPVEVSQNMLMASGAHPDYTSAVLEHYQPLFADWRTMLARAVDRGDIAPTVDFDAILRLLLAPLLLEPLLYRRTLTHRELDDHVTLVLRATAA
jgi:AcrR family transcriptional regulator